MWQILVCKKNQGSGFIGAQRGCLHSSTVLIFLFLFDLPSARRGIPVIQNQGVSGRPIISQSKDCHVKRRKNIDKLHSQDIAQIIWGTQNIYCRTQLGSGTPRLGVGKVISKHKNKSRVRNSREIKFLGPLLGDSQWFGSPKVSHNSHISTSTNSQTNTEELTNKYKKAVSVAWWLLLKRAQESQGGPSFTHIHKYKIY